MFTPIRLSLSALVLGMFFCGVPLASAQQTGTVTGRVVDQTAALLPGVLVELVTTTAEMTGITDHMGHYRFVDVPLGAAELTFRLINFTVTRRTVSVTATEPVSADVLLTLSLNADVIVTGTSTFRNVADVENPVENLVGIASAASQGAITAAQLEARPIMRPGEVLETVPGMIVSQHSGEGKANQDLPPWIQPRSRNRLFNDGRRCPG